MRTIGVISDTHGLLRAEALAALEGCDLIVHAGDVGDDDVLRRLKQVAPVLAVHGNTESAQSSSDRVAAVRHRYERGVWPSGCGRDWRGGWVRRHMRSPESRLGPQAHRRPDSRAQADRSL